MSPAGTVAASGAVRPFGEIPGPRPRPLLGNIPDIAPDVLGFWTDIARTYGDMAAFRIGTWPAVLLSDPETIESVLVKQHQSFSKHRLFFRHVTALFGRGLLTSDGDFWLRQRRLAAPAFHRKRLDAHADVMTGYTQAMVERWRDGAELDAHAEMMAVTMQIVARSLFDAEMDQVREIGAAFDEASRELPNRFRRIFRIPDWVPLPSNRRYLQAVHRLDALVERIVADRRGDPAGSDALITMLMEARDDDGQPMSEDQLRDEVVTLFLAGHETTALALSWAWWLLARHPEAESRLHDEVDAVLGTGADARLPTTEDLPSLPWTEAVMKESLRLYPPSWTFGREAKEDVEVGGYRIPRGTTVYVSPWVMHRDARWWREPEAFRPERWETEDVKALPRYVYLPFGGGPRICIGGGFAMMETALVLATVARHWRLEWQPDRPITPFPSMTLRPEPGVFMRARRR